MTKRYIIALDQGTTSSRALLIDEAAHIVDMVQRPFAQIYPQPGWVEHNVSDILFSQFGSLSELIAKHGLGEKNIAALGIDNQRETTVVWDRLSGRPIYNAIVWQCRRTAPMIEELLKTPGTFEMIQSKTGLIADAYFSASKIAWILDNVEGARERAEAGELYAGTIDTYLLWVLSGGLVHATDETNASRTMLYNIHTHAWDPELLDLFDIPAQMMPEVHPSAYVFGETSYPGLPVGIPIAGIAGDQQAALFGQLCTEAGQAKNTYGTGCFMLMNTGEKAAISDNKLITTIAASAPGVPTQYALEGSVFMAGATIQWLRDELHLIQSAHETEFLATSVEDSAGVYVVPAFTGLGAPWWDPYARGAILGLTRGANRAHIVRAALESLCYQIADLGQAMEDDTGLSIKTLLVDGGASANNFIMQTQADLLGAEIVRPKNLEVTAMGAAYLAGLTTGYWSGVDELRELKGQEADVFKPEIDIYERTRRIKDWHEALKRVLTQ